MNSLRASSSSGTVTDLCLLALGRITSVLRMSSLFCKILVTVDSSTLTAHCFSIQSTYSFLVILLWLRAYKQSSRLWESDKVVLLFGGMVIDNCYISKLNICDKRIRELTLCLFKE